MNVQARDRQTPNRFGAALEDAGFTGHRGRAEFGVVIGVDAVTVWRWAAGRSQPGSQPTRRAIADVLEKTEADIDAMFDLRAEAA